MWQMGQLEEQLSPQFSHLYQPERSGKYGVDCYVISTLPQKEPKNSLFIFLYLLYTIYFYTSCLASMQLRLELYLTIHHFIAYASVIRAIEGKVVPPEGSVVGHAIVPSSAGQIRVNPPKGAPTTVLTTNSGHTITGRCHQTVFLRKLHLIAQSDIHTYNNLWIGLDQQSNDHYDH